MYTFALKHRLQNKQPDLDEISLLENDFKIRNLILQKSQRRRIIAAQDLLKGTFLDVMYLFS